MSIIGLAGVLVSSSGTMAKDFTLINGLSTQLEESLGELRPVLLVLLSGFVEDVISGTSPLKHQ